MNILLKILNINWPLQILIVTTALFGFLMLYSVSGGNWDPWTTPQIKRFIAAFFLIFFMAIINISFWKKMSPYAYILALLLIIGVFFYGETGMGASGM